MKIISGFELLIKHPYSLRLETIIACIYLPNDLAFLSLEEHFKICRFKMFCRIHYCPCIFIFGDLLSKHRGTILSQLQMTIA